MHQPANAAILDAVVRPYWVVAIEREVNVFDGFAANLHIQLRPDHRIRDMASRSRMGSERQFAAAHTAQHPISIGMPVRCERRTSDSPHWRHQKPFHLAHPGIP